MTQKTIRAVDNTRCLGGLELTEFATDSEKYFLADDVEAAVDVEANIKVFRDFDLVVVSCVETGSE